MKEYIKKMYESDLQLSEFNYDLSNYMMLLFLSLATDNPKIEEEEFYAVLEKLKNLDMLTEGAHTNS